MKNIIYPILVILGISILYFWRTPTPPKIEVIDPLASASQSTAEEDKIVLSGRDDTDLLTLLTEIAEVQTTNEGEILAINGKENTKEFNWNIYLNGEPRGGLPAEIITANTDQIEIRYEKISPNSSLPETFKN